MMNSLVYLIEQFVNYSYLQVTFSSQKFTHCKTLVLITSNSLYYLQMLNKPMLREFKFLFSFLYVQTVLSQGTWEWI